MGKPEEKKIYVVIASKVSGVDKDAKAALRSAAVKKKLVAASNQAATRGVPKKDFSTSEKAKPKKNNGRKYDAVKLIPKVKLKTEKKGSELWVWAMVGVEVGAYKVEKKKFYMILTIITSKSGAARGSFAELAEDATRAAVKDVTRKTLNHPGFRAKLRAKGFDI